MSIVIFGGAGFVGLNLAGRFLGEGKAVTLFDRRKPMDAALARLGSLPGRLTILAGDVTDAEAVHAAIRPGTDLVVMGAAITADAARDAAEPATILNVNLVSQIAMLEGARQAEVRRIINLSSAAAYGAAGEKVDLLTEDTPGDPAGLYAITKWASERVSARLGQLWGLDVVSLRLSAAFGPWEHATGVRDTPSPQAQIVAALERGEDAILPRAGIRDWTYALDIADAVAAVAAAGQLARRTYNVSVGAPFPALDWGNAYAAARGAGTCRLAEPGEASNVDFYGPRDRAPMSPEALARDVGWRAPHDLAASAAHLAAWRRANPTA